MGNAILNRILAIIVLMSVINAGFAATETIGDYTYTYTIISGGARLGDGRNVAITPKPTGSLVLPSSLGGVPIKTIGESAFYQCWMTSLVIPEGVEEIENSAFSICKSFKEVSLPSSLKTIGISAFDYCSSLTSLDLPEGVSYIGASAFAACKALRSVTIPVKVTDIERTTFADCIALTNVVLHEGITKIDREAFIGCASLLELRVPASVYTIGENAFPDGCRIIRPLVSVTINCEETKGIYDGKQHVPAYTLESNRTYYDLANTVYNMSSGTFTNVGVYDDVLTSASFANLCNDYSVQYVVSGSNRLVIYPRDVQIKTSFASKTYDGTPLTASNVTIGGDGFVSGECTATATVSRTAVGSTKNAISLTWASGASADNYTITKTEGTLTVKARPVTVTTVSATKVYDGTPLTASNVTIGGDGFVSGECTATATVSRTAVGSTKNAISLTWASGASADNYTITRTEGTLTISPRPVTVTTTSTSKIYDGMPLKAPNVMIGGDGFVTGECTATASASQTAVGTTENAISLAWAPGASAENYTITKTEGTLTVKARPVTVTTVSATKVFDGTPLTASGVTVGGSGFVTGECTATATGSRTAVGTSKNTIALSWASGASADNYTITKKEGTLTVMPGKVAANGSEPGVGSVPSGGISKFDATPVKYDGKGHTINVAALEAITLAGSTPMFSYALTKNGPFRSEPYVFTDAGTHTVWYKISAENYDDFVHEAQVKILPRAVTITSGTATRNYDGTALTCDDYEVQGLIGADGINVVCSGRQVEFGSSPNYFTHTFRPGTNGDNYTISSCYGTLTVTDKGRIVIADGAVNSIPDGYFRGRTDVTYVSIPDSVTIIGDDAFADCTGLLTVRFPSRMELTRKALQRMGFTDAFIQSQGDGSDFLVIGTTLIEYLGDKKKTVIDIPGKVTVIDEDVFAVCGNLSYVDFPTGLRKIGDRAFGGCVNLSSVILPEGVVSIGEDAFASCWKIDTLELPASLEVIGDGAFENAGLIGPESFNSVMVPTHVKKLAELLPAAYEQIRSVRIPTGETIIMERMFSGCSALGKVEFADTISDVGDYAFENCGLVDLKLPDTVVAVGEGAFYNCRKLATCNLSRNLMSLRKWIFRNCINLTAVEVYESVETMEGEVFRGAGVTEVKLHGDAPLSVSDSVYEYASDSLKTVVDFDSLGWDSPEGNWFPLGDIWKQRHIEHAANVVKVVLHATAGVFDNGSKTYYENLPYGDTYERLLSQRPYIEDGRVFAGWFTAEEGGSEVNEKAVVVASEVKHIYAHWKVVDSVVVTFDPQYATIQPFARSYPAGTVYGESGALPKVDGRTGYEFDGWRTAPGTGSEGESVASDCRVPTIDTTLYARWKPITYKIIYYMNDGTDVSPGVQTARYDELPIKLMDLEDSDRPGHVFCGWSTTPGVSESIEYAGGEILDGFNLRKIEGHEYKLYAQWDREIYVLTLDPNGIDATARHITCVCDAPVTLPSNPFVCDDGRYFAGWSTEDDLEPMFNEGQTVEGRVLNPSNSSGVTLFACWRKGQVVNVEFVPGDGAQLNEGEAVVRRYFVGGRFATLPGAQRVGYYFDGWYTQKTGGDLVGSQSLVPAGINRLYAHWTPYVYYVDYDSAGGSGVMSRQAFTYDIAQELRANAFSKANCMFDGWTLENTSKVYSEGQSVKNLTTIPNGLVKLVARWKRVDVSDVTVTFDANGGTVGEINRSVALGGLIGVLPTASRSGYEFAGWFTEKLAGSQVSASTVVNGSVTYYAHWYDGESVTGVAEFVETEIPVAEGTAVTIPVWGGNPDRTSSVKVYLKYTGAASSDLDLKKTLVNGVAVNAKTFKFPVTLKWAAGEVGEKTITLKLKKDSLAEGPETFALQLGGELGLALGEARTATVTIGDKSANPLTAKVVKPKSTKGVKKFAIDTFSADEAKGLVSPGGIWYKGSKVTVKAQAKTGYAFGGWYDLVTGTKVSTSANYTLTVSKARQLEARFAKRYYVRALADPVDGATVTGSGWFAKGKIATLKAVAKTHFKFLGWYAAKADNPNVPDMSVKLSGSIYYKPVVEGDVTVFACYQSEPRLEVFKSSGGSVAGAGKYAAGKTATPKATVKSGYAFLGWFDDDGNRLSQSTSYKYVMGAENTLLHAEFKKEAELATPVLDWNAPTNLLAGVSYTAQPKVSGEAAVKIVSMSGLPAGLAYKSGKVSGAATTVKTNTVSVKVALNTNTKKVWTLKQRLVVEALPAWARGTYNGGAFSTPLQATVTVASSGKVSGKLNFANAVWTLSGTKYSALDPEAQTALLSITAKKGTMKKTVKVSVGADELGGFAMSETAGFLFEARQNRWKSDPLWATCASNLVGQVCTNAADGTVFKFGANATMTSVLKSGKYSFTGSAVLCPSEIDEENLKGAAFLYFAPNTKKKFKGAVKSVEFAPDLL